jgi:ABC-2 type transport system permease protein
MTAIKPGTRKFRLRTALLYQIVLEKISPEARSFSAAFEHSEYFVSIHFANMKLAQQALEARKISAIIRLRSNFNRQLYSHESAQTGY